MAETIRFRCSNGECNQLLEADPKNARKMALCAKCSAKTRIPAAGDAAKLPAKKASASAAPSKKDAAPAADEARPWEFTRPQRWIESNSDYEDLFLKAARPDLYRSNTFRLTELSVDATEQQVNKQTEKMRLAEKYGGASQSRGGILPVQPAPQPGDLRDAMQRLRDPQLRLLDEMFWFWPCVEDSSASDPALAALAARDIDGARKLWQQERAQPGIALHNLAVLHHLLALDQEYAGFVKGSRKAKARSDDDWRQAFEHWRKLRDDRTFWTRLKYRIVKLNDARLKPDLTDQLRIALPLVLFTINAQLAVREAEEGAIDSAKRHVRIMKESGFDQAAAGKALQWALEPIRERLESLCKAVPEKIEKNPVNGDREALRLMNQAKPLLAIVDALLEPGVTFRDAVHDEVALQVLACLIAYGNKTENWPRALKLMDDAAEVAASASAKDRIAQNRKTLSENTQVGNDWCGEGYWDLPADALQAMEAAREHSKTRNWHRVIPMLEELLEGRNTPVPGDAEHLVAKALAFSLNCRAVDELKVAMDEFTDTPTMFREIAANPVYLALQHVTGVHVGMKCARCGDPIWNEYTQYTRNDLQIIVCPDCAARHSAEHEGRKARLCEVVESSAADLVRAQALDPDNQQVAENLLEVEKVAGEVGASMPSRPAIDRCRSCRRIMPAIRLTCPHCGDTQWVALFLILGFGLALLIGGVIVTAMTPSPWRWIVLALGLLLGGGVFGFGVYSLVLAVDAVEKGPPEAPSDTADDDDLDEDDE
ncbi:MAG: hypothetical protein HYR84_00450 [Planctomycetes bacterium]|nr:hypothetical protein [Planctomycetota bacterium]